MAKDTQPKPDDKKNVPAGEEKKNEKAAPGNEPEKVDGKEPVKTAAQVVEPKTENEAIEKQMAELKEFQDAEKMKAQKKNDRATAKAQEAINSAKKGLNNESPDKDDKTPEPGLSPADEELKKAQEALLKSLDENASDIQKKNVVTKQKQTRAARPPTGVKKEEAPAKEPEPEKPPEPVEAPRPEKTEEVVFIKLSELFPFKDHPFQVRDDAEMRAMVDSVKDKGITQPATVRPREGGGYEMVSGHRRQKASELAGYSDMPCIVKNLTDEQAITQMVEDNTTQRENILPSERAKALKMQLDAIKRQGVRDGNGGNGQRSNEIVAERNNMNAKQVQRYIKLNDLTPELLKMVDEGVLKFTPAVELAFVSKKNQQYIAMTIESQQSSPNLSQAQRMRKLDEQKQLKPDVVDGIMLEEKKEDDKVILSTAELSQYFGKDKTPRDMKDTILKLLDDYKVKQAEISPPEKKSVAQEKA